jgi:hypothetical protein
MIAITLVYIDESVPFNPYKYLRRRLMSRCFVPTIPRGRREKGEQFPDKSVCSMT